MPVNCQLCLIPGYKTYYYRHHTAVNDLVNRDRYTQDELGTDYIMINVTGNTNP